MKILCSLFLVPALFLAAPAARAQSMSFQKLEGNFDAAVLEFRTSVILDRGPAVPLARLQAAMLARNRGAEEIFPQGAPARARMESAFDVLLAHALRWELYYEDIEAFIVEVAEARMREELAALDAMLASGELTSRPRYEMMVSLIHRICARTIELAQAPDIRPRLAALLAPVLDQASHGVLTSVPVRRLRDFVAAAGLERSKIRIAKLAAAGKLLPIDLAFHAQRDFSYGGYKQLTPAGPRPLSARN